MRQSYNFNNNNSQQYNVVYTLYAREQIGYIQVTSASAYTKNKNIDILNHVYDLYWNRFLLRFVYIFIYSGSAKSLTKRY